MYGIDTPNLFKKIIWCIILLSVFLGLQNIYQVIHGVGWAGQPLGWEDSVSKAAGELGRARWVGLWDGMNVLCLLFVIIIPFVVMFFLSEKNIILKIFIASIGSILIIGAYLTKSRGGLISLLITLCILSFTKLNKIKAFALVLILIAAFLTLTPARTTVFNDEEHSASKRVDMWEKGLEMVRWNPIIGVGRGNFKVYSYSLIAHNSYIEIMAETGLVGFFLWSNLLYVTIVSLIRAKKETSNEELKLFMNAMSLSLWGYIFTSMFITTEFELLYLFIALSLSLSKIAGVKLNYGFNDMKYIVIIDIAIITTLYSITKLYWIVFA
jgi:O-antigen ligase